MQIAFGSTIPVRFGNGVTPDAELLSALQGIEAAGKPMSLSGAVMMIAKLPDKSRDAVLAAVNQFDGLPQLKADYERIAARASQVPAPYVRPMLADFMQDEDANVAKAARLLLRY